jgi:cobalt-zinc-cadmium efflux system outer membrane protein
MKRVLWPLGLAALLSSPLVVSAQPTTTDQARLTLDQAQQLAAQRSLELSAARHEVDAANGGVRQAGARRNPELTATVEDMRSATRTTTATLGFPLELGGKRAARMTAAERARDVLAAQLANVRAKVRAEVAADYFAVVAAQERVELAQDSARLAAQAADVVSRRVVAGKVSPVDATRARVDAANARLELIEARATLDSARHTLAALWGDLQPRFERVDGSQNDVPSRPPMGELLRELDASPSIVASRLEIDARTAQVDVERSKAVPDVVVSVGARRDDELGLTQAVVGVTIPLSLFDRNQGATHQASRLADKARDDYQATRVRVLSELDQASTQLATAQASLAVLRDTVLPAAQQAYDASTTGFEAGKFGFLDVIDAQRSLLQARARTLNTLVSAWQAATAIDRLLGR